MPDWPTSTARRSDSGKLCSEYWAVSVLACSSPLRTAAANPPDSVRRPWNHSPKSVEPPRSWASTRWALLTPWRLASSVRCSSREERAKA